MELMGVIPASLLPLATSARTGQTL
uniref:Uncharacterized protein n=1 Tax=Arundo donax TaxID=35708 RepID=A0A0A9EQY3_ARUDO